MVGRRSRVKDECNGEKWRTSTEVLAFAPKSNTIVSVLGGRHGVRVWNAAAGLSERTLDFPNDSVFVLAISPDGQLLATAGSTSTIKILDLALRTERFALNGHTQRIRSLAFSPDGMSLASGSGKDDDGPVRIWDLASGTAKHVLKGHTYHVYVALSPDGRQLVSASGDNGGGMHLWDVATGRDLGTFSEQFIGCNAVAFSPNGQMIATGGNGGRVVVLDSTTRKTIAVLLRRERDQINSVAFSADNKTLAVGGVDGAVHLWDIATAKEVKKLQIGPADGSINNVAYDATGRYLLSGNGNASVAVLRLDAIPAPAVSVPSKSPDIDLDRRAAE